MRSVYIVQAGDEPFYKIGIASDVKQRVRQIRTNSPLEPRVIATRSLENAHALEQDLHAIFERHHLHGEWFCIKHEDDLAYLLKCHAEGTY